MFHKIKAYFIDDQGRSYYNNNGKIDNSSSPKPLDLTPEGQRSILVAYERTMTDKDIGVVRTYTLPSDFVRVAGMILKYIAYTKGFGEKVYLLFQQFKVTVNLLAQTFKMNYQFLFKGQIDFTSFSDNDSRTTITVSDGGIAKQIKAKDTTNYEIDLDNNPNAVLVKHDGVKLSQTNNYIGTPGGIRSIHFVGASFTTKEGNAANFAGEFQVFARVIPGGYNYKDGLDYQFYTSEVIPGIRIKGAVKVMPESNDIYALGLHTSKNRDIVLVPPTNLSAGTEYSFDFDVTFDSLADEKFYLTGFWPNNLFDLVYREWEFTISFKSRYKATYVKGLPLSVLGKELTKKITGNDGNVDIGFLQQNDNLILTSGDGIRGIADAKIKTTLKNYKDFIWVLLAASRGIENGKLVFGEFEHFLKTDNPIVLDGVAKKKVTAAKEFLYNKIHVGYPVQQIDDVNGKSSFHNTLYFSGPVDLEEPKILDLITSYIADPYYHENLRINLSGKTTTDDKGDNEIMVLDTEKAIEQFTGVNITIGTAVNGNFFTVNGANDKIDLFKTRFTITGTVSNDGTYTVKEVVPGTNSFNVFVHENIVPEIISVAQFTVEYYTLWRGATGIVGVPDAQTIYNVRLSPKRIFLKHFKWINSVFYGCVGKKIMFESTEKNADFESTISGVTIKERSNYIIGADILFKPFYMEYDTIVPINMIEELDVDINRCFLDEWYGEQYKGFLRKITASTNYNQPQEFKLLASADTDLTNLIFE